MQELLLDPSRRQLTSSYSGMINCRLPQDIAREGSLQKLAQGLRRMRFSGEARIYSMCMTVC